MLPLLAAAGCDRRKLPERDSPAARVYVKRCGQCHQPFDPRAMTSAMWQVQVAAMDAKIRAAGIEPLAPDQREAILDYLTRNAGQK